MNLPESSNHWCCFVAGERIGNKASFRLVGSVNYVTHIHFSEVCRLALHPVGLATMQECFIKSLDLLLTRCMLSSDFMQPYSYPIDG